MYNKIYLVFWLFFLTLICQANNWYEQDVPPSEVMESAKKELPSYLEMINAEKTHWNYAENDSVLSSTLGKPFQIFVFDLTDSTKFATVKSIVEKSSTWRVPIIYNGIVKVIMTASRNRSGNFEVSGFTTELVDEVNAINSKWPENIGFHPVIITTSRKKFYFTIPEIDSVNLTSFKYKENKNGSRAFDNSLFVNKNNFKFDSLKNVIDEVKSSHIFQKSKTRKPEGK